MALISLLTSTRAMIDDMELDVSLSETHDASATLTQSAAEDGDKITDNVLLNPRKLTMQGIVTKTPLGIAGLLGSAASAAAGALTGLGTNGKGPDQIAQGAALLGAASVAGLVAGALLDGGAPILDPVTGQPTGKSSRQPTDVWAYLVEVRDKREPITIVTALEVYDDMVMTSLSTTRTVETVNELNFTATFEQIKLVSSLEIDFLGKGPKAAEAAAATGKQGATAASAAQADNSTVLYGIFDGAGMLK